MSSNKTYTTTNNDDGSLKVGTSAGTRDWKVGDQIQIQGEGKIRQVTYIMGKGEKCHLCFGKGTKLGNQGKVPQGEVTYEIVGESAAETEGDTQAA